VKTSDIMQRQLITATPAMAIGDAIHLMIANRIGGLPVIDEGNAVVGILSETDLLRRVELGTETRIPAWQAWLAGPGRDAADYVRTHACKVGEVMSAPVISVSPDTELAELVALMESRRIRRVPVLQDGRLVGIVTRADLIMALERLLPKVNAPPVADAQLRRQVLAALKAQRWVPRTSFDVRVENGVVELIGVITDPRERDAARVLLENIPSVRAVVDRLLWIEASSGIPLQTPKDSPG